MKKRWALLIGSLVATVACYRVVAVKTGKWPFSARQAEQKEPGHGRPATVERWHTTAFELFWR